MLSRFDLTFIRTICWRLSTTKAISLHRGSYTRLRSSFLGVGFGEQLRCGDPLAIVFGHGPP